MKLAKIRIALIYSTLHYTELFATQTHSSNPYNILDNEMRCQATPVVMCCGVLECVGLLSRVQTVCLVSVSVSAVLSKFLQHSSTVPGSVAPACQLHQRCC